MHSAARLSVTSSLDAEALRLGEQGRTRMGHLRASLGDLPVDELGQMSTEFWHAVILRATYARLPLLRLRADDYLRLNELFGRVPVQIFCVDFLPLPPSRRRPRSWRHWRVGAMNARKAEISLAECNTSLVSSRCAASTAATSSKY